MTVYVTVYVRTPKMGERTQFHTLGLGKNPRKYWILVESGIAGRAYKAAALPIELRQRHFPKLNQERDFCSGPLPASKDLASDSGGQCFFPAPDTRFSHPNSFL